MKCNDFVIRVATANGSGSQSSNTILVKSLFRMGLPVSGKNLFPSNIQGLPTWFSIRVSEKAHLSRKDSNDIMVAMNLATLPADIASAREGGFFIYNSDLKFDEILLRKDVINVGVPFKKLVEPLSKSVKLKKLLINMVYVGVVADLLGMDMDVVKGVVKDFFGNKPDVVDLNVNAIEAGQQFANENLKGIKTPCQVKSIPGGNDGKILIDGNTATSMGMIYGGCTFVSWYPITPSSSVVEGFDKYANQYRQDSDGNNTFVTVQAEDELSAISMVLGASWAGARSMTATSGPGLSLMAEAAGLSYFAEIPAVIWNVQRAGPSTGLPTRTMQGDVLAASKLSHGDTEHVVLFPGNPSECFEFAQTSLDLSERLQTLVIVLSDLDLGMNLWISDEFKAPTKPFDRGKILDAEALEKAKDFKRYADVDGDGIPYRTLPGTEHPNAAYFTRGTGHNEDSSYSESNEVFRDLLLRLKKKYDTARSLVPQPVINTVDGAEIGIIAYGTSDVAVSEALDLLKEQGSKANYLRVRALPFSQSIKDFVDQHKTVFVVEQNRDGQMYQLMLQEFPNVCDKLKSVVQFDGLPLEAEHVMKGVLA